MKILGKNSRKLHLKLTLKFAPFFILVSVITYWFLSTKYEDEVQEMFQIKSNAITKYFQQAPLPFIQWSAGEKNNVQELIYSNEAAYIVLEDSRGILVDAVNLKYAEKKFYLNVDNPGEITLDKLIHKVAIPIEFGGTQVGKVYVGFNSLETAQALQSKYSFAALFSLAILTI